MNCLSYANEVTKFVGVFSMLFYLAALIFAFAQVGNLLDISKPKKDYNYILVSLTLSFIGSMLMVITYLGEWIVVK